MMRRIKPLVSLLPIALLHFCRRQTPVVVTRCRCQRHLSIHPLNKRERGRGVAAMMRHLDKCSLEMLPVMAHHRHFPCAFNISRKQYALLPVIDFDHARAIVSLHLHAVEWPVRRESKPLPLPAFTAKTGLMAGPAQRAFNPQ